MNKHVIVLNDEQHDLLSRIFINELEQEFMYRVRSDGDTDYYVLMLSIYEKLLGKPKNYFEAKVNDEIMAKYGKQIAEIKKSLPR